MTFNIRYGLAEDGENHWDHRKHLVIDRIKAFSPDLLGMQECRDDSQGEFIKANLKEYEFHGTRRGGNGDVALEMAPVLFKKSAFQLSEKGCFWLSETPGIPGSKSWGSTFPRTATWAKLAQQGTGREVIFVNTHFDYEPSAIDKSAQLLQQWITQATEKHPVILTGDFNADKNSSAYKRLTLEAGLADVYRQAHPNKYSEGTFHGFGKADELKSIDWVLASNHFEVVSAEIDYCHEGNIYPSDHYPVIASLQWI